MNEQAARFARILVPVDFTEASRRAVEYALALGSLYGAIVDVLHVWHTSTTTQVTVARNRAKQELRDFTASIPPRHNVELRRRTDHGDPYLTIFRMAQLSGYDSIVCVPPEPGRVRNDNVALALVHTARVPVLLVPRSFNAPLRHEFDLKQELRRILLPAAFAAASTTGLACALALGHITQSVIETLFVRSENVQRHEAKLEAWIRQQDPPTRGFFDAQDDVGDLEAILSARAARGGYGLFVASVNGCSLGADVRDACAERLIMQQRCPTLCVRADAN